MIVSRRAACTFGVLAALTALFAAPAPARDAAREDDKKPSLSLKISPTIAFAPARVRTTVEVRGGADDYQDFYCPTIEWEWGDGTSSESAADCDPYEPGRSTIRRRFSAEHVYRQSGSYKVLFRLKQKKKTIAATNATVQVRPGLRDGWQ